MTTLASCFMDCLDTVTSLTLAAGHSTSRHPAKPTTNDVSHALIFHLKGTFVQNCEPNP